MSILPQDPKGLNDKGSKIETDPQETVSILDDLQLLLLLSGDTTPPRSVAKEGWLKSVSNGDVDGQTSAVGEVSEEHIGRALVAIADMGEKTIDLLFGMELSLKAEGVEKRSKITVAAIGMTIRFAGEGMGEKLSEGGGTLLVGFRTGKSFGGNLMANRQEKGCDELGRGHEGTLKETQRSIEERKSLFG
jgi:hypothetical protein